MSVTALCLLLAGCCPTDGSSSLWGYVHQPAYSVDGKSRLPVEAYHPQPGDILLLSNANVIWRLGYAKALTAKPGHCALVIRMPDGRLGVLEAGFRGETYTRVVPLEEKFRVYKGTVWVRQRKVPLSRCQSECLTSFAMQVNGGKYALVRLLLQTTPIRTRGPIRTQFIGKPQGVRSRYTCAEVVLEALVYCSMIDAETARPAATYPRDMFFDESPNPYLNRHLDLSSCWCIPRLWSRKVDTSR